jgi:CheY-like chemotaxis protein
MGRTLEGRLVLVVDDDEDNVELLVGILALEGAEVRKASSGREALSILATWRPHVLVLDLAMPEMDGCDLLRAIRSDLRHGNLPAIAATAHAFARFKQAASNAGFNDLIVKPYDPQELIDLVAQVIRLAEASPLGDVPTAAP